MPALSWDLHVHPGLAEEGRWADGGRLRDAAARAGTRGFVWKSHKGTGTWADCEALPHSVPFALASITLNHGAGSVDLERALARGTRWIWGPSRLPGLKLAWDLPLPAEWPALKEVISAAASPLALATSHLGAKGRRELAETAASLPGVRCSVTHSLYLADDEVKALAALGAVFEADLYTLFHSVREATLAAIVPRAELCWGLGSSLYLTSDAGQAATGDPYQYVARCLTSLDLPEDVARQLAVVGPQEMAAAVFAEAGECA